MKLLLKKYIDCAFFLLLCSYGAGLFAQLPTHPRGVVTAGEVEAIRNSLERAPISSMFKQLRENIAERESEAAAAGHLLNNYDRAYLAVDQAGMYLLTAEQKWAEKAYQNTSILLQDSFLTNPFSRGLTRATLLQHVAIAYDFCYSGWTTAQRTLVNESLLNAMFSVNANMGYSANYNIESNWMGVRFGSVILAASVWDEPQRLPKRRSRALPLIWDATKRLREHIAKNVFVNGWNGESLGYHNYGWSFVGPALIALQNGSGQNPVFQLEQFAPKTLSSLVAQAISTVAITSSSGMATKIDLSDDNLHANLSKLTSLAWRLYPEEQQPTLQWLYHYVNPGDRYSDTRNSLLFAILFYPGPESAPVPPDQLSYCDPDQGIVVFRNTFQDKNDIVAAYSATAKRVKGHQGPDTNTPRLLGLGVPWIIGGGRTGEVAGQSNLFPAQEATPVKGDRSLGQLLDYRMDPGGGGAAIGVGSCVGVLQHRRSFQVSFDAAAGAKATLIIADSSINGKRFRICTPEYNQLLKKEDGYLLRAPNGSTMRVRALNLDKPVQVTEELVRYGGSTKRNNPGIWFEEQQYEFGRAIDLHCNGTITVAITLQPTGEPHPPIKWTKTNESLTVGEQNFYLPAKTSLNK